MKSHTFRPMVLAGLLAVPAMLNAATTYTVIDFGLAGTTAMVGTINQFAESNNNPVSASNLVLNTTAGVDSNIRFSTNGTVISAGAAGSFAPSGSVAYTSGSTVIDGWIANEEVAFGDIWQGVANASNGATFGQTIGFTFSGLAANTDYTFKLLSGRANTFGGTKTATYNLAYDGDVLAGGGTKEMQGSAAGLNAAEYIWTFSTGATPANAVIRLTGSWNVNALVISSENTVVPEPSAALLGGLGVLALLRRRRS